NVQAAPSNNENRFRLTHRYTTKMSPIAGKIKLVTIRFKLFFLFERMNCLITHIFTKEKAVKAPIFTREVATSRLNTKAGNASKPTKIILNTGEFSFGCK